MYWPPLPFRRQQSVSNLLELLHLAWRYLASNANHCSATGSPVIFREAYGMVHGTSITQIHRLSVDATAGLAPQSTWESLCTTNYSTLDVHPPENIDIPSCTNCAARKGCHAQVPLMKPCPGTPSCFLASDRCSLHNLPSTGLLVHLGAGHFSTSHHDPTQLEGCTDGI